ncbi:hypothetical protein JY651_32900 [Pyxidicoccus parkwayensis]|uniref:Uncharacterized protein n=1 Tax=Pyxidicoccus parkwayensis TaxID=2813578 RepID=A0ABX7NNQ5_9BACT|nr:hypothetical protein [Pyxidicoccus parkwaysis]QSQ20053.1 hypothetical protein JY651_32900 [Pyxidicoccus parkwaysis]
MKRLSLFCAVMMSMFFAGTADAAATTVTGYVCSAMYTRQNNVGYGQGYVTVQVHNGPGCTGGVVGTYQYLGTGAANTGYQYSEAERLQLFDTARTAATQGTRVNLFIESVGGAIYQTTYSAN